jgi:hypothetical protein
VAGFVGTGGRIESERVAGLRRNPHTGDEEPDQHRRLTDKWRYPDVV